MKKVIPIILLIFSIKSNAQDTIINKLGERTIAQIIDTAGAYITYIPISTMHKDKVDKIIMAELTTQTTNQPQKELQKDTRPLNEIIKKGNKVFVSCKDAGGKTHTINALESWGLWEITEDISKCDFILKMDITLIRKAEAHITLISQIDNSVLLDAPKSWVLFADYGNPKRAAIAKNFQEKFIPLIEKTLNEKEIK